MEQQQNTKSEDLVYREFRQVLYDSFEQHGYIGQPSADDGVIDFHHYILKQETKKLWFIPIVIYNTVAEIFEPRRYPLKKPVLDIRVLDIREEQNLNGVAETLRKELGPKGLEIKLSYKQ